MDWTKAKTILIVALVVTNLVLIATYLFQNDGFETGEEEIQDVTIRLLAERIFSSKRISRRSTPEWES